jgi:hypothetical protein
MEPYTIELRIPEYCDPRTHIQIFLGSSTSFDKSRKIVEAVWSRTTN